MATCSAWTYSGITPAVFKNLQATAKQHGASIPAASAGSFAISAAGMKAGFRFKWDKSSGRLVLQCVSKPMISCGMIKQIADQIISGSGGHVSTE